MKKKVKSKVMWIYFLAAALIIAAAIPFFRYQNNAIQTTVYEYKKENAGDLCIAQVSDLHEKNFGDSLNAAIKAQSPDLIVITGDLINSNSGTDIEYIKTVLCDFVKIAPTYYVSGNHETLGYDYKALSELAEECGVIYLDNASAVIEHDGVKYNLIGLADPQLEEDLRGNKYDAKTAASRLVSTAESLKRDDMPNIMLAHHPEFFYAYVKADVDLVLCGHAHGGQWRIFGLGLFAPAQGLFPKYVQGTHTENNTTMAVSRGLGPSRFPLRLFNRPELVIIRFSDIK